MASSTPVALYLSFFFGKDFLLSRVVLSVHDIYEAPMSHRACCTDDEDSIGPMTTKTLNCETLCIKSYQRSKAKIKQKLISADKKINA